MKPLTRELVRLMADDTTGRMLDALREQPLTAPQLAKAALTSQNTAATTLDLLLAHGIVNSQAKGTGNPGRPSRVWRLAADDAVATFDRACDAFKYELLRSQLDEYNG